MNIKQLERSQKTYMEIKALDAEIVEIEKVALLIADGNAEIKLSLTAKDTSPKQQPIKTEDSEEKQEYIHPFGIIRVGIPFGFFSSEKALVTDQEEADTVKLTANLSDNLSLNVLAILLYDKQQRREKLIKSLAKLGVTT